MRSGNKLRRGAAIRRRLARTTSILVLTAAVSLGTAGAVLAVSDTYGSTSFHPFTMPGSPGCVGWFDPVEGQTWNCDPVDLTFPGQTWQQVRDRLRAKGWTTFGIGSDQWLHFNDTTRIRQSVQLFRYDSFTRRYHMRVWGAPGGVTVAAVHHEQGVLEHSIDKSWEDSEAFVRGQLCSGACSGYFLPQQWTMQDGIDGIPDGDTTWRGWANNANAAVIP
jgi:hypothetical protein